MEKEDNKQQESITAPGVLEKYQEAGKICKTVMAEVLAKCVPNASIVDICALGDKLIEEAVDKVFTTKKLEKGIGFPTTVSCNEICGHYSPCKSEDTCLKAGDLAKVNLGVHIDGYIALLGHTVVVGEEKAAGKKADATMAAWTGLNAAVRLLKAGTTNTQITEAILKSAESFKCSPLEGVLSHEVQRWLIDGNSCIINRETFDQKVTEKELQVNEIYVLDVYASSGEGKPKESDLKTNVFKRAVENSFDLKSKSARAFFSELKKRFPNFGFSLRAFEDELLARAGAQECYKQSLIDPYPV